MFLRISSFGFSLISASAFAVWILPRTRTAGVTEKAWSVGEVNRTYEAMQFIEIAAIASLLCMIALCFREGWKQAFSRNLTRWTLVLLLPVLFVEGLRICTALSP